MRNAMKKVRKTMANEKRLIDAYALIRDIDNYYHNSPFPHPGTTWLRGLELAVELALKAPTVDAVEVVRCNDCKHYKNYGRTSLFANGKNIMCGWCQRRIRYDEEHRALPDDFCSYGERIK